jgi:hypothetical protein
MIRSPLGSEKGCTLRVHGGFHAQSCRAVLRLLLLLLLLLLLVWPLGRLRRGGIVQWLLLLLLGQPGWGRPVPGLRTGGRQISGPHVVIVLRRQLVRTPEREVRSR